MKDRTSSAVKALRPTDFVNNVTDSIDATQVDALLSRAVAAQVGPRHAGVVYTTPDSTYEVLAVHYGHEARIRIGRARVQFAVTIRDVYTDQVSNVCTTWSTSDRMVADVPAAVARYRELVEASAPLRNIVIDVHDWDAKRTLWAADDEMADLWGQLARAGATNLLTAVAA